MGQDVAAEDEGVGGAQGPGRTLTALTRNGAAVSFTTETIKGVTYAAFPATTGTYAATYTP